VKAGKIWVIELDISAFFDEVSHDILMHRVSQLERDKRVLKLIGRYLRAPMIMNGDSMVRTCGTPQGGPLSPLLANIYLDPLDKELEKRNLSFCRYADDINIYVESKRSGERILASISAWIKKYLKLEVNVEKSGVDKSGKRQILGFSIQEDGTITLAEKSIQRLKYDVRNFWQAGGAESGKNKLKEWEQYLRGWCNYYKIADNKNSITRLEGWIRRHMRKWFWLRWHNKHGRLNALKRLGAKSYNWKVASSSKGAWRIAAAHALQSVLNNRWLQCHRFWVPSNLWAS
jgi:group II intron reverse transcriptase/maturase